MWTAFWFSHALLFIPFVYAWVKLSLQSDWVDEDIEFYKSMLLDVCVSFAPPLWGLLVLGFVVVIYQDYQL